MIISKQVDGWTKITIDLDRIKQERINGNDIIEWCCNQFGDPNEPDSNKLNWVVLFYKIKRKYEFYIRHESDTTMFILRWA